MEHRVMPHRALTPFVDSLLLEHRVAGPQQREGAVLFDDLDAGADLCLEYTTTTLSPKKLLLPPREELLSFCTSESLQVTLPPVPEPLILFGVHPCDLAALKLLDTAMRDTHADPYWVARREALTVVGADCLPDDRCFCVALGTDEPADGYDLFLTDTGDELVVSLGSEKGRELLDQHASTTAGDASAEAALAEFRQRKRSACGRALKVEKKQLPLLFKKLHDNPVWEEQAKHCLACGTCSIVCPTCFCFDVWDEVKLSLTEGTRSRRWDGCLLKEFAAVASGENFRRDKTARYRHRYLRKFDYLPTRVDGLYCVGCGRCSRQCVADIADPVEVINKAIEHAGDSAAPLG